MVLGIVQGKIIDPSGTRTTFRARGQGDDYRRFYAWLNTRNLCREWDDWPWYGWEFVDPADAAIIATAWSAYLMAPDPDEHRDYVEPPPEPLSPEELVMASDLQHAIQDEIHAEIMRLMRGQR